MVKGLRLFGDEVKNYFFWENEGSVYMGLGSPALPFKKESLWEKVGFGVHKFE